MKLRRMREERTLCYREKTAVTGMKRGRERRIGSNSEPADQGGGRATVCMSERRGRGGEERSRERVAACAVVQVNRHQRWTY